MYFLVRFALKIAFDIMQNRCSPIVSNKGRPNGGPDEFRDACSIDNVTGGSDPPTPPFIYKNEVFKQLHISVISSVLQPFRYYVTDKLHI